MDPLRGRAEHISARTAAVIHMNTRVIRYEDLKCISGTPEFPSVAGIHQTAAGPPASNPRKKPALFAISSSFSSCQVLSWLHIPNTADEIHRDEARGKTFDKVPATMELLQQVSVAFGCALGEKHTCLYPNFA